MIFHVIKPRGNQKEKGKSTQTLEVCNDQGRGGKHLVRRSPIPISIFISLTGTKMWQAEKVKATSITATLYFL